MKKLICLIISSLILCCGCVKKEEKTQLDKIIERDKLIVGVSTDSKPFGFINKKTGNIEGFDIDVAKYITKDLLGSERKIELVPITPASRIEAITSGLVDIVVATMTITPQREYFVDFSVPYYIAGQTAIVKKDSNIYHISDLKDKTTIIVLGTTAESNIRRIIPVAKLNGYKSYKEAFEAFQAGKGDAMSTDNTILSGFLMDYKGYRILKNKISQEPYAIGIKQNEDDDSLKKNLDISIIRMQKNGTINNLKKKWQIK